MKKSLFYVAAASALMLTACSSENDVLQNATPTQQQAVVERAVGFDIYTPAASNVTRAGLEGTMTTDRLKFSEAYSGGFGVYAYQVQDANNGAGDANATKYSPASPGAPNFMNNEKLLWNSVNQGWYYNPLKYWPNETDNDSQSSAATMEGTTPKHLDRLSFFAYAPYVKAPVNEVGIVGITQYDGKMNILKTESKDPSAVREASVKYWADLNDPNNAVDLLWGVAPAGGLTYTAVNGRTVNVKEGEPLVDMTKPDVNTNMKFLFQHALARIGVKVVAAIDQVSPGGKLDPNTKITIEKITLKGYFGETGILNLDNDKANIANWTHINNVDLANDKSATTLTSLGLPIKTLTLQANHTTPDNGSIATHLQWVDNGAGFPDAQVDRLGVTTVRQDVIQPSTVKHCVSKIESTSTEKLLYSETTPYYKNWTRDAGVSTIASSEALPAGTYYTYGQNGSWTELTDPGTSYKYPNVVIHYVATKETGATDVFTSISSAELATKYSTYTAYTKSGSVYTPVADVPENGKGHYVLTATMAKAQPTYAAGDYYKRDANYFMVIPTNNVANIVTGLTSDVELKKLRTITVQIEYYITTEDTKLNGERAQTKNVVTKDVLFPSLANGKSYNLNLILGLTSVKMEAEVDDWKVINVQGDLPQNTAD